MIQYDIDSTTILDRSIGKTISDLMLDDDDALYLFFEDGSKIKIFDDGQQCYENRYMRTDDNLNDYVGTRLLDVKIKDGGCFVDEYDDMHEIQFLEVVTDKGSFTMSSHNEHNGYYSGFCISITEDTTHPF